MRGIQQKDLQPERPFFHVDLNEFVLHLLQQEVIFVKSTDLCVCASLRGRISLTYSKVNKVPLDYV